MLSPRGGEAPPPRRFRRPSVPSRCLRMMIRAAPNEPSLRGRLPFRRPSVREVRLASGLVLFAYVATHFMNHALGAISVAAMEKGLVVQLFVWQSAPGTILLYAALLTHMGLGFFALYQRRQFRWSRLEATQLVLGLTIPLLLVDHVFAT